MKISAGELKGRVIRARCKLRPTSSKVRESVFNIIGDYIRGSIFADLYAGTGAVGIEAMSRGAEKVFFVEASKKMAAAIEETLRGCGCRGRAEIIREKAANFLGKALSEGLRFDIVFLDPPYYSDELDGILPVLSDGELLRDEGIVIAEHLTKKKLPEETGKLKLKKTYKYGDTTLTLYRKVY